MLAVHFIHRFFKWLSFAGTKLSFMHKEKIRHFICELTLWIYPAFCCIQPRRKRIWSQPEVFDFILPNSVWVRGAEVQALIYTATIFLGDLVSGEGCVCRALLCRGFPCSQWVLTVQILLFLLMCCCRMRLLWTQETSFLNSNYIYKVYTHIHTHKHMHTFDIAIYL